MHKYPQNGSLQGIVHLAEATTTNNLANNKLPKINLPARLQTNCKDG